MPEDDDVELQDNTDQNLVALVEGMQIGGEPEVTQSSTAVFLERVHQRLADPVFQTEFERTQHTIEMWANMPLSAGNYEARLAALRSALPPELDKDVLDKLSEALIESSVRTVTSSARTQREWELFLAYYMENTPGIGDIGFYSPGAIDMDASSEQGDQGVGGEAGESVDCVPAADSSAEPPVPPPLTAPEPQLGRPVDPARAAGDDSNMDVGVPRPRPFPDTFGSNNQKWPDEALYTPVYQSPLVQQTFVSYTKLSAEHIAHLPAGIQMQTIGEQIYGEIETVENNRRLSARLTGMLLVLERADLMEALENREN